MYDYPDLYREAANALRNHDYYHEALRYYEPLQQVSEYTDISYIQEMAACYRAIGLTAEAEECYNSIIELDDGNVLARKQLAELHRASSTAQYDLATDEVVSRKHPRSRRRTRDKRSTKAQRATSPASFALLAHRIVPQKNKKLAFEKEQSQEEDLPILFQRRNNLMDKIKNGNGEYKAEWMAVTKILVENFRDNKVFYPFNRHSRFYGYSDKARGLAARSKHELDNLAERSISCLGRNFPLVVSS